MQRRRRSTGGWCLFPGVPTGASARRRLEVPPLRECASWHHPFLLYGSLGVLVEPAAEGGKGLGGGRPPNSRQEATLGGRCSRARRTPSIAQRANCRSR